MRRGGLVLFVVFLIAAWVGAGPAFAQEHAPAAGGHAAADDSPFAGEAHQILDLAIWTIVVFLILLFVLARFAWKPMLEGLQRRERDIREAREEAHKVREEAQKLHERLQAELAQAAQKVHAMLDEARRDAEQAKAEMIASARAEIQTERERLHREIQVETDQALQSLWTRAAELATQVSAAAPGRQIDGDGHRRLIDEALAELKTATKQGANGHA